MNTNTNSQQNTNSKKRLNEDDMDPQIEKEGKFESENKLNSVLNSEESQKKILMKEELLETKSQVWKSSNRMSYFDGIWKVEIPQNKCEETTKVRENILNRDGEEYYLSLANVFYKGSLSSTLVFMFQNGNGIGEKEFNEDAENLTAFYESDNDSLGNGKYLNGNTEVTTNGDEKLVERNKNGDNEVVANVDSDKISNESNHHNGHIGENGVSKKEIIDLTKIDINIEDEFNINAIKNSQENNIKSQSSENVNSNSNNTSGTRSSYLTNSNESNDSAMVNSQPNSNTEGINKSKLNLKGEYFDSTRAISDGIESPYEVTFDISITITVVNLRQSSFSFRDVKPGEIIRRDIAITTYFYSHVLKIEERMPIIIEISIKKNYNFNVGITGIVNEAMTCYMNSMLQTLNILGYFKKAVYQIPLESEEDRSKSVAYSLQRLFYDLKHENSSISTNRLIKSFGWSRDMIFIQHDVQEFNLLLSDIMENKMKGTKSEGTFKFLFEGKSLNYIKCLDVDYTSKKEESFYDLQLTVRGCKDIYESLNKYTESEILDGDNKYEVEGKGKQRAEKGITFNSFPNVLIFQLKRFEYNPRKDSMDKINDMFEFYEKVDLKDYINKENSADENNNWEYCLHSVVVHKGNINNGHYFAYIRPNLENKWYCFNDEIVREADLFEVLNNNFGGVHKVYKHKDRGNVVELNQKWDANAYILVYIKQSIRESILCSVLNEDIPIQIREIINNEKEEEKRIEKQIIRKHKNMNAYILSKEILMQNQGLGICPSYLDVQNGDRLTAHEDFTTYFNLPKDLKILDFMNFISKNTGIPIKYLLLFTFTLNCPIRVTKRFDFKMNFVPTSSWELNTLEDLVPENKRFFKNLYLYIDFDFCKLACMDISKIYSLLELNTDQSNDEEELFIEQISATIYYPKTNKWKLKHNTFIPIVDEDNSLNHNVYKLLIFKYVQHFIDNDQYVLLIDRIVPAKIEAAFNNKDYLASLNLAEVYKKRSIIDNIEDYEESLLLENTSGDYTISPIKPEENLDNDTQMNVDDESNINNKSEASLNVSNGDNNDEFNIRVNLNEECSFERVTESNIYYSKFDNLENLITENTDTDSLILIINLKEKYSINPMNNFRFENMIDKACDASFNQIWIPMSFLSSEDQNKPIGDIKFPFGMKDDDDSIPRRVFEHLKNYSITLKLNSPNEEKITTSIFNYLLEEYLPTYVLTSNKLILSHEEFKNQLNENYLTLLSCKATSKDADEINDYPLLKYIGTKAHNQRMDFGISYLENEKEDDFRVTEVTLYDENNNAIVKLHLVLPNEVNTCEDILDYIYDDVILCNKIYDFYYYKGLDFFDFSKFSKNNFYFILQNPTGAFCYDLFIDKTNKLSMYEKNSSIKIKYRLQAYTDDQISQFKENNKLRLFIAFQTKEGLPILEPFIFYMDKSSSVLEVKNTILKKMKNTIFIQNFLKAKSQQNEEFELTLNKLKFYTYTLLDYKPQKDILLLNTKDEEPIQNYLKMNKPHNILIEFLFDVN